MQHTTVIEPQSGWRLFDWRELYHYRDLFLFLVWRDIKVLYAQTVLGFGWAILRPLIIMVIFTVVFGRLARMPTDGIPAPVFFYIALVPWTYFSTAFTKSADSLVSRASMWSKVYFPRMILPLTPVVSGLVDFVIAASILGVMMAWYGIAPSVHALFLPALVLIMMVTAAGAGLWLSALAVRYRDVRHANHFLTQLLMFAAPVVWPTSLITAKLPEYSELVRMAYGLYPMAGVIEGFRAALTHTVPMPWDLIAAGAASAALLFVSGAAYFRHNERNFADVV